MAAYSALIRWPGNKTFYPRLHSPGPRQIVVAVQWVIKSWPPGLDGPQGSSHSLETLRSLLLLLLSSFFFAFLSLSLSSFREEKAWGFLLDCQQHAKIVLAAIQNSAARAVRFTPNSCLSVLSLLDGWVFSFPSLPINPFLLEFTCERMRSIAEQVLDVGIVAWLEGGIPLIFSLLGSTPEELCQKCALSDQASFPSSEIAPFTLAFVVDYALSLSNPCIHAELQGEL
ncbi:uncharacterized protein LOC112347716 [Selaginella moellendorffii]|uniref:uncharacterized protein LOC112347716 n=1 Tax=Selaginella moellendorffii TaxID=88036 RepID=UPI000D1C3D01|nr:uncharacterized protein LOC112347716 [Selaginella moellendorffii]|eukprot:XP_024534817.1 uncharacterized protein LOC112347716 [Selaginella moellendorffii]